MGALTELEIEVKVLHDKGQAIKKSILEQLECLPDNNKIERLSRWKGRCFLIKFSDLNSENWLPQYYDFELQYKNLSEFLNKRSPFKVVGALRKIIREKQYTVNWYCVGGSCKEKIKLHPQVITHLKTLL